MLDEEGIRAHEPNLIITRIAGIEGTRKTTPQWVPVQEVLIDQHRQGVEVGLLARQHAPGITHGDMLGLVDLRRDEIRGSDDIRREHPFDHEHVAIDDASRPPDGVDQDIVVG